MPNVEFKADLRDLAAARAQCRALGATPLPPLRQHDRYVRIPGARLKRRVENGSEPRWIFYRRDDAVAPRLSRWKALDDRTARLEWGVHDLPTWIEVVKRREPWLLENVRIHLDEVERLGAFLEFEAIVDPQHDEAACRAEVDRLRRIFAPVLGEAVGIGYADLLEAARKEA